MYRTPTDSLAVADVWTGTPAAFGIDSHRDHQAVAFYDATRRPMVALRDLAHREWTIERVPIRRVGWDAHNGLAVAIDDGGRVHVAGNVHGDPLAYARTRDPFDVGTFERRPAMVGAREERVTYPRFFRGPDGELVFEYRDGESGAGDWLYDVYDSSLGEWCRLLDAPLTAGGDWTNAYPYGPVAGPDGYYHVDWVWRDSPDAATNHDLSYARSPDLRSWERSDGAPLSLPITPEDCEVVDPVPPSGGVINDNTPIGFDVEGRPVVSYHKHDRAGNTQLYVARSRADGWEIACVSDWDYRWEFGGHGSIPFEINVSPVSVGSDGRLRQPYDHAEYGSGTIVLDPDTLVPVDHRPWSRYLDGLSTADRPEMQVNWVEGGERTADGTRYAIRWESLPPNRDRERDRVPPTTLWVYAFASG